MSEIIKEVMKILPEDKISAAGFEGANIVVYTEDKDFFFDNKGLIKKVVDSIKKRVELRPDPAITLDMEKSEKIIKDLIPEEAKLSQIIFDPQRSQVIIEAEKPGLVIGKQGAILKEIRTQTLWVPLIKRTPALKCQLIENIRSVLYQNSDYRRKFLDKVGHRIYDGWKRGKKDEWVRLSVLGGGRQVGRSCLLLQTPESRVLLDCGINVADDNEAFPFLEAPEFNINELDAVIITHSHMDHSGFLPYLYKYGYRGPVYCTLPTRDVMSLLQLDYIKIQKNEGTDPIYTADDVKECVKHCIWLDYGEVTDITPDIRLTFYNAGHILGSAMAHLHIGNGLHNLLYTADTKYGRTQLLDAADTKFPRLETVIVESTYGGKDNVMNSQKAADEELQDVVKRTVERGGKILMPVLGSGRAQEIMVLIDRMVRTGMIDSIPVHVDGMVWDITAIHTAYPEFMNSTVRKQIFHKDANPFLSEIFRQVGSAKERKQLVEESGPCIILATSGMLVGGPSVEYLRALGDNPKNSLVLTCYQGPGSMGNRIQNGEREFVFRNGPKTEVLNMKMEYHKLTISNHSDRRQLMSFLHKLNPKPKKVIINHGENSRCLDLASSVHKTMRVETSAPRNLEAIRIR